MNEAKTQTNLLCEDKTDHCGFRSRSFQRGRASQSGLRVNEEAHQLDVDLEADLFNVDEQVNQA
ncbi:hypothetical protein J6590_069593 [Homalodisca vitripennis]|nr:hypothetical protein J6590_069593 [Homalodisca vitripennis]